MLVQGLMDKHPENFNNLNPDNT